MLFELTNAAQQLATDTENVGFMRLTLLNLELSRCISRAVSI